MSIDKEIWKALLRDRHFFRFKEIKKLFPGLHDQKLTTSLRRLEKDGLLVRDTGSDKNKPVNIYLAIDPMDPKLMVRVIDWGYEFEAIIEWSSDDGSSCSINVHLGELDSYIRSINGKLYLEWPKWILRLIENGKIKFEEI
jgi:DNA-binding HxlR family transcriptional regulator